MNSGWPRCIWKLTIARACRYVQCSIWTVAQGARHASDKLEDGTSCYCVYHRRSGVLRAAMCVRGHQRIQDLGRRHWYVAVLHTHTHPFNGPFSGTTRVSRYQKGRTSPDFTEARDSEWQWHQQGHMQVCISLQTDNHASTPPLVFLQAGCPFCRRTNSVKALKALVCRCLNAALLLYGYLLMLPA